MTQPRQTERRLSVELTKDTRRELDQLATRHETSKREIINRAIRFYHQITEGLDNPEQPNRTLHIRANGTGGYTIL